MAYSNLGISLVVGIIAAFAFQSWYFYYQQKKKFKEMEGRLMQKAIKVVEQMDRLEENGLHK